MPRSAWVFGQWPSMPQQSMEVTANGNTETITVAAGDYYLDDSTSSRSYVETLSTALATHGDITTATVWVGRDRLVHFAFDIATAISFTTTEGRDLIGMNGNLASTTSDDADTVSRYLWVPDRFENPGARLGRDGDLVKDTRVSSSGGATRRYVVTQFNEVEHNDFDFRNVPSEYVDSGTDTNNGGEYRAFWDVVVSRGRRFKIYRDTLHDEASTTDVGLLGSNQIGPFRHRGNPQRFDCPREIEYVERFRRVQIPTVADSD